MQLNHQALLNAVAMALANPNFGKVAKRKPAKQAKKARPSKEEFEVLLIAAANKAGFPAPEPRFNILTWDMWKEKGRIVRKGEKSLRVQGRKTGLFHEVQTDPVAVAA